jgi:hypothetical protein
MTLLHPERLWTRAEVLARPSCVPKSPGVYCWYFTKLPYEIDVSGCHHHDGLPMLYTGIAPKQPSASGKVSEQTLRNRLGYHYRGNAEGSTLRLTLGCLVSERLGIELRRVGSGKRMTFHSGEPKLSEWMDKYTRVCWMETPEPWLIELEVIDSYDVPLNLMGNTHNAFHPTLTAIRAACKRRAREMPVV